MLNRSTRRLVSQFMDGRGVVHNQDDEKIKGALELLAEVGAIWGKAGGKHVGRDGRPDGNDHGGGDFYAEPAPGRMGAGYLSVRLLGSGQVEARVVNGNSSGGPNRAGPWPLFWDRIEGRWEPIDDDTDVSAHDAALVWLIRTSPT